MWFVFALLSAVFAALTSILAKVGIEGVNSNLATAIRTVVVAECIAEQRHQRLEHAEVRAADQRVARTDAIHRKSLAHGYRKGVHRKPHGQ